MDEPIFIDRPPRIQPELPIDVIKIPKPPEKQEGGCLQIAQIAMPLVTIMGFMSMALLRSGGGGGFSNLLIMIPMGLGMGGAAGLGIFAYFRQKRKEAEAIRAYEERLVELNRDMHNYHDQQRRFYTYNYPALDVTFRIARNAREELERMPRTLRAETRLWERRTDDEDFGVVRLGMGTLPSTVLYEVEGQEEFDDPQYRAAQKLQDDSRFVPNIPVIISLRAAAEEQGSGGDSNQEEAKQVKEEEDKRTPVTHALGIAGQPGSVYEFVRSLLSHFMVFHAPMDARLYVLGSYRPEAGTSSRPAAQDDEADNAPPVPKEWEWTQTAPHCQGDEQHPQTFFVNVEEKREADAPARNDDEESPLSSYLEGIRRLLAQRKLQMEDREGNQSSGNPAQPLCLLVVDLLEASYNEDSPLYEVEGDPALAILLAEGALLGAAVIFLVPERSKVPSGCQAVIEIERTTPATNIRSQEFNRLHFRYAEVGLNSFRYVGEADELPTPDEVTALVEGIAALQVRQSAGASLASAVPFMDLMGYRTMADLRADADRRWGETVQPARADWMRAKIGKMAGNKPRTLIFSAKRDGVHGMVAGSTGSGKSELLISLITGMAVTFDPTVLNFVLVDYKGGGAFKEFDILPHCVDIITNLAGEGVTRMFTAINAEMRRRQKLNVDTGTKNIVDYRQKGFHKTHQPYPFLFIIIDEFAEMIADRAEYKNELESITRVGRAQGVSLILAAQRPSGVTDQMRSNIKFRIALRVETTTESREMLRRSDAAYLPNGVPGRGYLQVGNDEIELIQVAYSGDKYVEPGQGPPPAVIWPERHTYDPTMDQEPPELYKVIVAELEDLARTSGIAKQRAPWPDFLPSRFYLSTVLLSPNPGDKPMTSERYLEPAEISRIMLGQVRDPILTLNPSLNRWLNDEEDDGWIEPLDWAQYAVRPIIGLIDNPFAARQLPLTIEMPRGHVAVFGASGWGKTTFLRTLVVSLAATHSPSYVHIYLLDLGGRNLEVLDKLPHIGAVISPDEEGYRERVEQLMRELDNIIEKRKTLLSNVGQPDIYEYNIAHPQEPLPAIVVGIDNFTEFKETFGGNDTNVESTLDRFLNLARECKPYGIHLVITAGQPNALSTHLFNVFTERFTFKLADTTEYRTVVGTGMPEIGDTPGRGYVKFDRQALSFQVALPLDLQRVGNEEGVNEYQEIEHLADNMKAWIERAPQRYNLPLRIGSLPRSVLFKQLLARRHGMPLDDRFIGQLRDLTRDQWAESTRADAADWLKVTIALAPGDRLREMHLEAKKDGVHGLVAGGTGAGKSELLMTLIVGLALRYDPSILNFVLVDYKGGGAFKPFEALPHCVDSISNLNKAAVRRMFTSINAEMQRRQKMNADTGTKDIVEYRQKGLHLPNHPNTRGAYPHLFIIIDEYAEMISSSPEFKSELESITRVGRAQGVNLLLAAQRPTGVTDQMRANIKFRICLRVEDSETSREMLRRPDAAFLPNGVPGRGYLQVGNDGIELIQVAYTGENHDLPESEALPSLVEGEDRVRSLKFYELVVNLTNELLQGERPRTPWPPFLPTGMTLADPLLPRYLDRQYHPLLTRGRTELLALNPFLHHWLKGDGLGWPGVDWNTNAMRAVVGLLDDPYNARQLPMVLDLTKGHGVLFGASGWGKTTFFRTLILSLAGTHSPSEFQAHILDLGGRNLEVLSALPHVGTVIMPDERGYEERVQQLLRELNDITDTRKRLFSEAGASTLYEFNASHPDRAEPAVLVVIDNFSEYLENFGNAKENDPNNMLEALVSLVRQAKAYGIHFVISAGRLNVLSSKLYSLFTERLTLRLSDSTEYSAIVGGRVDELDEIQGRGYVRVQRQPLAFQVALPPGTLGDASGLVRNEAQQIRAIGKQMQAFIAGGGRRYREPLRIAALPKSSSFRQLIAEEFGITQEAGFLDELQQAVDRRWARNLSAEHADWLRVPLGIISGNRRRTLALEAKRDGVHGMIAGGTGSGKSELLMTLIVGLALYYPPEILNFVLVDYKGGGAFKPFERLPHVVDIVTNLNKAAVARMFSAINAEIRRRQKLNVDTGTKDIVDYRAKGLHLPDHPNGRGPYPHLFVIIDEYAEMIDDNPDYKMELESITRVGRAQGVNLLLASQRPKGVTDQMRANIKLRLCLRVEQTDTSIEMLRRPDAAFLPNGMPGRGYLQIGNENLELIQVSWTGEAQPDDRTAPVIWPDRPDAPITVGGDVPHLFDMAVTLSSDLVGGKMAPKPWPAFLPEMVSLQSPIYDPQNDRTYTLTDSVSDWLNGDAVGWPGVHWGNQAMRPVVGLVDDPTEARQVPLRFDLSREHLVVLGDSGWGKTSFLRSLLVSLAATHSPDELHLHVLDLGGRNFRSLDGMPHVGALIYADEDSFEERLYRLLDKLGGMVGERGQLFSNAGVNSLYEYNQRFPDQALPATLVVIDNFAPLLENYESLVESTFLPLVRRSLSAGLTFIVSANGPNNIPSKLQALFGQRITFKQSNPERYMEVVGRGAIEIGDIPGRGYIRLARRPLLFQAALSVGALFGPDGVDPLVEADELRRLAENMKAYVEAHGRRTLPDPIETLPEVVPLIRLLKGLEETMPVRRNRIEAVLGQSGDLRPAVVDLKRMLPHFVVAGPPLSGKTTLLYNWVFSLTYRYPPEQVGLVLVDLQRKFVKYGGSRSLAELPHVLAVVEELEQLEALTPKLKLEAEALGGSDSPREIFVVIDNFDDTSEEIEGNRGSSMGRDLAGYVRRYGREGLHFIAAGGFDGVVSDLKRRIQSTNFGIGLRTPQALDTLRVQRTPAGFRGKELPVGRGYTVRSGIPTLIQAASPYEGMNGKGTSVGGEDEEQRAMEALDHWVELIVARYPDSQATWTSGSLEQASSSTDVPTLSAAAQKLVDLTERALIWERRQLKNDPETPPFVQPGLEALSPALRTDEDSLKRLLKGLLQQGKVLESLPVEIIGLMDDDSMLRTLDDTLPALDSPEPEEESTPAGAAAAPAASNGASEAADIAGKAVAPTSNGSGVAPATASGNGTTPSANGQQEELSEEEEARLRERDARVRAARERAAQAAATQVTANAAEDPSATVVTATSTVRVANGSETGNGASGNSDGASGLAARDAATAVGTGSDGTQGTATAEEAGPDGHTAPAEMATEATSAAPRRDTGNSTSTEVGEGEG